VVTDPEPGRRLDQLTHELCDSARGERPDLVVIHRERQHRAGPGEHALPTAGPLAPLQQR
jgi:hypothetical protein